MSLAHSPALSARSAAQFGALRLRLAGAAFLAASAVFLTGTMLAASIAPGYDFNRAAISDLGVIRETALLFNALLVTVGALNIAGGYLLFGSHGRRWLLAIYVLAGVGAVGAGLVPLNAGGMHSLFALIGFLFFNVQAIASTVVVKGAMRPISVVAGLVGIVYLVLMIVGDAGTTWVFGSIGHGGSERMIVYPAMLWLLALGGYLMARTEPAHSSEDDA